MLILSRRINEKIVIPENGVSVQVVALKSGQVRLGIDAPDGVKVYREELWKKMGTPATKKDRSAENTDEVREIRHAVNNRLNTLSIGVVLLRDMMERSMENKMPATLEKIENEIRALSQEMESTRKNSGQTQESDQAKPQRVLLVEDDHNERELMAGLLRMSGFEVDTAGDGADALDYLVRQKPDGVLLDMVLPRYDGIRTMRAIRENPSLSDVKVFGVSGHQPGDLGVAPNQGRFFDGWFQKPLKPKEFVGELHELMKCGR